MLHPEDWETTRIQRGRNAVTGMIEGNDDGYGAIVTLKVNPSPLVVPDVDTRSVYDGFDAYTGKVDPSRKPMPGGLEGGKIVVRETFARDLKNANDLLQTVFKGKYRICVLDGFRSGPRQRLGYYEMLKYLMNQAGLKAGDVDTRVADFIQLGKAAHGTFCYLQADLQSAQAKNALTRLAADSRFMEGIREYATRASKTVGESLALYITVSANSGLGRAADVPVLFEWNAHAGGGAADVMLLGANGLPINPVPFDYPGPEARMDFMEDDANFDLYVAAAKENDLLSAHLGRLGLSPTTFTRKNWDTMRDALRVWYHLVIAKGWTYYSEEACGENWHLEGANVCRDVLQNRVFDAEDQTAQAYPNSGNPGHTLQVLGKDAIAVWGGKTAHELLAKEILA